MTIENMIKCCDKLTQTENILAQYIIKNKNKISTLSIQQLSEKTFVSKSAIHRFCKKIGVDGFNELKVKVAQDIAEESKIENDIDVNFPFLEGDTQGVIAQKLIKLYETTIRDTYKYIDVEKLNTCVSILHKADVIDIYTHAHNSNVAENFMDKMRSIGRMVNCTKSFYDQRCTATASKKNHAALLLSYSGKSNFLKPISEVLYKRGIETIWIGRVGSSSVPEYIKHRLYISDRENFKNRISQFSSHIAMQYMLDLIYSCIFKRDYNDNIKYIKEIANIVDNRDITE
ncbi:MurR/RpiR family transcriptional regulator [Clostridium beijerinckii]|uniref:MurR/RpiR family transcriptional regulator n=1 Tax=Clostridium beijerinckii TaxID=1520 RepID=UPI0022DF1D09|nr:MurR/RpiR family transcriptional regulator [Clostridium beijerinckii]